MPKSYMIIAPKSFPFFGGGAPATYPSSMLMEEKNLRGSPFHDSMTHDLMTLTQLKDDSRFVTRLIGVNYSL